MAYDLARRIVTMQNAYRTSWTIAPDGVRLAVYEWGDPAGPEIVLIHGFSQSAAAWKSQMTSGALARFRTVAYDLRGHGASEAPPERALYAEGKRWADELHAVMEGAGLRGPTVVAWSWAGQVVGEYLLHYGHARLAALNLVAARVKPRPQFAGPVSLDSARGMASEDLEENLAATRAFVVGCFATLPPADEIEEILAYNLVVPPAVRAAMRGGEADFDAALASLDIPVLVTHGAEDRVMLPEMSRWTAAHVPGARLSIYDGVGHCPFREDSGRFDRELAELVDRAQGAR
jgi:non-heme chloroperoxidase